MSKRSLAIVMIVALVMTTFALPASGATHTVITEDTTLTADHYGTIEIAADEVTLDCRNHRVIGDGEMNGIFIRERYRAEVKNCRISGFNVGIRLSKAREALIEGSTANHNFLRGVVIADGTVHSTVRSTTANNNGEFGFAIWDSGTWGNLLEGNTANNNGRSGFVNGDYASAQTLEGNVANGNLWGFDLGIGGGNRLTDNSANGNVYDGIKLWDSDHNWLEGNTTNSNGSAGISIGGGGWGNRLYSNTAQNNDTHGIVAMDSTEFSIRNNKLKANHGAGVAVALSQGELEGNLASNNWWGGYLIQDSDGMNVRNNTAKNNDVFGFRLINSDHGLIDNNSADRIGYFGHIGSGFILEDSSYNRVLSNYADASGLFGFHVLGASEGNDLRTNEACRNGEVDAKDESTGARNLWFNDNAFCATAGIVYQ